MKEQRTSRGAGALFLVLTGAVFFWGAVKFSQGYTPGAAAGGLIEAVLDVVRERPFDMQFTETTPLFLLLAFAALAALSGSSFRVYGKWRRMAEHGTAQWGNPRRLRRKWEEKGAGYEYRRVGPFRVRAGLLTDPNLILSRNMRLGMGNASVHRKNRNFLVIGGSGTRKSTGLVMPNLMQCAGSFVVTDPSGELYRGIGGLLEERGYEVRCLNLVDMEKSHHMNPFRYIEEPEDIGRLATSFIQNTEDKTKKGGDAFWTDAMKLLLMALIAFVWEECPEEEQNFASIVKLVMHAQIEGEDMGSKSLLDTLFEETGARSPESLAYQNYLLYMGAPPRTRASVVITLSSRLTVFTLPACRELTESDELELDRMGDRKQAVFCIIPQAETTFNFLVGLVYTSLFTVLYRRGERRAGPDGGNQLPVPVQVLMDEFANVAQPESFEQILATCRKYNISIGIFLQNITQLRKLYEKEWESIAGNCDTLIYLGGNEAYTWKYISEALDKETVNVLTGGRSGRTSSVSQQIIGRELLTKGEVRGLPDDKCIVLVRGENGVLDDKYDLFRHPNIRKIAMGGAPVYSQRFTHETEEEMRTYREMMLHFVAPDLRDEEGDQEGGTEEKEGEDYTEDMEKAAGAL